MNKIKIGSRQLFLTLFAVAVMLTAMVLPAANVSAAQRLTNNGPIDGIDSDPDVGMHNSYAWCAALFEQDDDDYLWIGTNRDIAPTLLGMMGIYDPAVSGLVGIPEPGIDNAGKIYRYSMNALEPEWELMYEDPAVNGYRKMIVFNGDLYVFAGATNVGSGYNYAAVYRFSPDFQPGDTPEVVLWEVLPGGIEYYRAAFIHDEKLYVSSFDFKVYRTDGVGLRGLAPNNSGVGVKSVGWETVVDLRADLSYNPGGHVFDIAFFNDALYIFAGGNTVRVSPDTLETTPDGFRVYKVTDIDGAREITQVVGDQPGALYPSGIGIAKHSLASPFILTAGGEEYMYVTTFANGPAFMVQIASNGLEAAFNDVFCPVAVYRFDADDHWEVVVGDKDVAVDSSGTYLDHVGNRRAGFFPNDDTFPNWSANQYFWWMAEDVDGRLWLSSWDVGVFRQYVPLMAAGIFVDSYGGDAGTTISLIMDVYGNVENVFEAIPNYADVLPDLATLFTDAGNDVLDARTKGTLGADAPGILNGLIGGIGTVLTDAVAPEDADLVTALIDSMTAFVNAVVLPYPNETVDGTIKTLSALYASMYFIMDRTNPPGFDLFYSDDGVNWFPYTVTGFNDPTNYGGRIVLPTKYGVFVMTANPFNGCQVWRLGDVEPSIATDMPGSVKMNAGDSVTFKVRAIGLDPDDFSVTAGDGTVVSASMELVKVCDPIMVYSPTVTEVPDILGMVRYVEEGEEEFIPMYIYEVTLTLLKDFEGTVEIVIVIDGMELRMSLEVTSATDRTVDWGLIVMAVLMILFIVAIVCISARKT